MIIFRHINFQESKNKFSLLQEYMVRPILILFLLYSGMLLFLLAERSPILIPGIMGLFVVTIFGNIFGTSLAKGHFLEIGFSDNFFYLRSAFDIARNKNLKFYPLVYASAQRQGNIIHLNYIDQTIKLKAEDWEKWDEIWLSLNNINYGQRSSHT